MSYALPPPSPSRTYFQDTISLLFFKILPAIEKLRKEVIRAMHVSQTPAHEQVLADTHYSANFPYIVFEGLLAALDGLRTNTIIGPGLPKTITTSKDGERIVTMKLDSKLIPEHRHKFEIVTIELTRLGPSTTSNFSSSIPQPPYRLRITMQHTKNVSTIVEYTLTCERTAFQQKQRFPLSKKYRNVLIDISRRQWEEAFHERDATGNRRPSIRHDNIHIGVSVYVGTDEREQVSVFRKLGLLPFDEASERYKRKLVALSGPYTTLHKRERTEKIRSRKPVQENIYERGGFSMLFDLGCAGPRLCRNQYWERPRMRDKLYRAWRQLVG
ncbi:hypothetical protein TWF696_001128 [Orbilia brochopaga]|uniref:Uncharacterized protein n=1 Tax=Orbilia brochopaga TaxID=3140254 RepID=A0AAV9VH14_9PEZI